MLIGYPERREFAACACRFSQRAFIGTAHQNEGGPFGIGQGAYRVGVLGALRLEPRQRPQATGAGAVRGNELGACAGKRQQTKRMPRGRGVEHDVIIPRHEVAFGQQRGEFIECRDLDRAGSGELLLHAADCGFGKNAR